MPLWNSFHWGHSYFKALSINYFRISFLKAPYINPQSRFPKWECTLNLQPHSRGVGRVRASEAITTQLIWPQAFAAVVIYLFCNIFLLFLTQKGLISFCCPFLEGFTPVSFLGKVVCLGVSPTTRDPRLVQEDPPGQEMGGGRTLLCFPASLCYELGQSTSAFLCAYTYKMDTMTSFLLVQVPVLLAWCSSRRISLRLPCWQPTSVSRASPASRLFPWTNPCNPSVIRHSLVHGKKEERIRENQESSNCSQKGGGSRLLLSVPIPVLQLGTSAPSAVGK